MEWKELRAALRGLTVYREELETEIGRSVTGLLDALHRQDGEEALAAYTGLFAALCREEFQGLGDWLWDRLRFHESAYSLLIDQGGSDPVLEQAARQDVDTLVRLVGTGCSCFLDAIQALLPPEFAPVLAGLSQWRTGSPFDFDALTAFYREHGAGLYAKYRAFLWEDGSLIPVADPDCPHPVELLGYEQQRQQVLDNTRLLVAGRPSNNVLLFGDGGTGKSATVKSMLYLEGMEDLRLIEIQKENLVGMPRTPPEVHPVHRRPGLRPGRPDLLLPQDHSGGRAGEAAGQCGHLRHLQPASLGTADLLRAGGRGGRHL